MRSIAIKITILLLAGTMLLGTACGKTEQAVEVKPEQPTERPVSDATPIVIGLAVTPTPVAPEATEEPEPVPTDTPVPEDFTFTPSEDLPLPGGSYSLQKGLPYAIDGTVTSRAPITRLYATISTSKGNTVETYEVKYDAAEGMTEVRLLDNTFSKEIQCLSEQIKFQSLSKGDYKITIGADNANGETKELASSSFSVVQSTWIQLVPNNFRNNYTTALKFFGSEERFMFKFKFTTGAHITLDPEWSKQYVGKAKCLNNKEWSVHVDAVPYFEKACEYLENTYIRVHGTNGDSKAVKLSKIVTMDGTMVRRFTNDKLFISHHSFGTTVDINAHTTSNKNHLYNRDRIYQDVTNNLVYNGIEEVNGKKCYDFTYSGDSKELSNKIPERIANYLIYELAFFRAGFSWGVYYPHTSDAMHFTLTELSPDLFETGEYAMRKVFEYID